MKSLILMCALSLALSGLPVFECADQQDLCNGAEPLDVNLDANDNFRLGRQADSRAYSHYKKASITSKDDFAIRDLLDNTDELIMQGHYKEADAAFTRLLEDHPLSPRAHFGRATALEKQWQQSKSTSQLLQAVEVFDTVLQLADTPDTLYIAATQQLVDATFSRLGQKQRALDAQLRLVERFPDSLDVKNNLANTYYLMGKLDEARRVLTEVLQADPSNGFAQAYYGFILIRIDGMLYDGSEMLIRGLRSRAVGTRHRLLYETLGNTLLKLGRRSEASETFQEAAKRGLMPATLQRSPTYIEGLTARPWWTVEQFAYRSQLEAIGKDWRVIRDEAAQHLDKFVVLPTIATAGQWSSFVLYNRGVRQGRHCQLMPRTCEIVERAADATSCTHGEIRVSALTAGTALLPHTGPSNCRIRTHLGLRVPAGARVRVAGEERTPADGEWLVFDDSFEHEVWNDADDTRLVLIVDFWHPQLTDTQRRTIELPSL